METLCSLALFSGRYRKKGGGRCKCNSISRGYSVWIVLIFHRWNSINWNARNQAARTNFFFFLFFKCACHACDLSIGEGIDSSFSWIEFTRGQELRADVTLKMNFRVQCSQLWKCVRFFFHHLELLVTCLVDDRWRQELDENHWYLEIEFSSRNTFHCCIDGWMWIILSFRLSFFFYFVHAWVLEIKKTNWNCLITLFCYI